MVCVSIGEANPDIAGIGILIAFVIQAVIAVFVSFYAFLLSNIIQNRWKDADPDPPRPLMSGIDDKYPAWLKSLLRKSGEFRSGFLGALPALLSLKLTRQPRDTHLNRLKAWEWIVGKQPDHPRKRTDKSTIGDESTPTSKRLKFANRILLAGNDAQTFTGIALLISALAQSKTLGLYHMHILYDVISLVVISNCAASICIFTDGPLKGYTRLSLIAIWAALFVSYFSIFATHLQDWDEEAPLHCYHTRYISHPGNPHPRSELAYLGVTFLCIMVTILYAILVALAQRSHQGLSPWQKGAHLIESLFTPLEGTIGPNSNSLTVTVQDTIIQPYLDIMQLLTSTQADVVASDAQNFIIGVATLQCPLHIYSIFTLRATNAQYLDAGGAERNWGFGQIVAIVLLGANILPIADGVTSYMEEGKAKAKMEASA